VLSSDDSESDGDGQDDVAVRSLESVMSVITANILNPDGDDPRGPSDVATYTWQSCPTSRGITDLSLDKIAASMMKDSTEPTRSTRITNLMELRAFTNLTKADQASVNAAPKRDQFGRALQPLRYTIKSVRPGAYYRVGIAAHNSAGWSPFIEYPEPVRIQGELCRVDKQPLCFVLFKSKPLR
jgi:hypothetical protein